MCTAKKHPQWCRITPCEKCPFWKIGKENSMKYIDAEKLISEIERLNSLVPYENGDRHGEGLHDAYKAVKKVIYSLQQEQPEMDLEKEFNNFLDNIEGVPRMWHSDEQIVWAKSIAKHFFEFGIRTRKEEVK